MALPGLLRSRFFAHFFEKIIVFKEVRKTLFFDEKPAVLSQIYQRVHENTQKGSRAFYARLPLEDSILIREDYLSRLQIPVAGNNNTMFFTPSGTHVATGYIRVVVGDYGAYLEFSPDHLFMSKIEARFGQTPDRPVKYIWMQSKDASQIKIYEQKRRVSYADYKPGLYYIAPQDLRTPMMQNIYRERN